MASVILSVAGSAIGGTIGGPPGAFIGAQLGRAAGATIDNQIFDNTRRVSGPRLSDLTVQTSSYGEVLPILYGTARLAGNIIWSQPIKESASKSSSGGKGGGTTVSATTYHYSVDIAIAICEGEIDQVHRVWADAKLLDLSRGTYRIYHGTEIQQPDWYIESIEGIGRTPAYRGVAYVVIQDFPLADYGNRIPNFTFEVSRQSPPVDVDGQAIESMIESVVMIPGSGEFVYDTQAQNRIPGVEISGGFVQTGLKQPVNHHTHTGAANALLSLDQMQQTLPNADWVAVVVNWFGTHMDAGQCEVLPGVEYAIGATTEPEVWSVGAFERSTAHAITLDTNGSPVYGGTPDDESLKRYITELHAHGYNVLLLPMFLMDTPGKPWRGRVTGSAADVNNFFTKTNGYNGFVEHYAQLVADLNTVTMMVQAFVIGSELKGLTSVTDMPGHYPAVDQLVALASNVRSILGSGIKLTYAADWSEYHHTDGGWYHLDPLWASADIDMVGIDAYFPLTDSPQDGYDVATVKAGWTSGEGYDWYYTDPERTIKAPLAPAYAWKNITWWWENTHVNPDMSVTDWLPESKPIWFTEYGFPSVDGATNQPNVFYDPSSTESALPRFSQGMMDIRAQRLGIAATESQWAGSAMIERRFVWTWDARPYPYWPDLAEVWSDGDNWRYGHWINGKLGVSGLGGIISDLLARAGLQPEEIMLDGLGQMVEGFVLTQRMSVRDAIELLQQAYLFDVTESAGVLRFQTRGQPVVEDIAAEQLVLTGQEQPAEHFQKMREASLRLPQRVDVSYFSRSGDYLPGIQSAMRDATADDKAMTVNLPMVMAGAYARLVAEILLYSAWAERLRYRFALPMHYLTLEPGDSVTVTDYDQVSHRMRITRMWLGQPGFIEVEAVSEDVSAYSGYVSDAVDDAHVTQIERVGESAFALIDLPMLPDENGFPIRAHAAATGITDSWRGMVLYRSGDGGSDWDAIATLENQATMGQAVSVLPEGVTQRVDEVSMVDVGIAAGAAVYSASNELALLNGANAALLGDEVIQFRTVQALGNGVYRLSGLLRGRLGTEWAMPLHTIGERFVLLDGNLRSVMMAGDAIGLERLYRPVSVGRSLSDVSSISYTYSARSIRPYAPVHLRAERDSSGNAVVTWVRRSRGGGAWRDYVDVPLNEAVEAYDLEVMNGGAVIRNVHGLTDPTYTYTAAQQQADFGSPQSEVTIRVYQLSEQIGRGNMAEDAI